MHEKRIESLKNKIFNQEKTGKEQKTYKDASQNASGKKPVQIAFKIYFLPNFRSIHTVCRSTKKKKQNL